MIGAQLEYLLAPEQPDEVLELLTSPDLRIVTLTITEGGYHVDAESDSFLTDHPDVAHDIAGNDNPRTVFGFAAEALARHNGDVARTAFVGFARARNPELGDWIDTNVPTRSSTASRRRCLPRTRSG